MIDYFFGNYLIKFNNIDINYNSNNKLAIVLVATKTSFWLPLIIKNTLDKIKKCTFYFFGTNETIIFVQNNLKLNINYFKINDIKHISNYNKILLDIAFWNTFNEEYILIIQPDCIILRDVIDTDFKFDYIGAICGDFDKSNFIINGGLSMRKKNVMIEICKNLNNSEKNGTIAEDIIYTKKIRNNNSYKFPTWEDCMNFSIESIGNLDNVLGIHGTDKYYIDSAIKMKFVEKFILKN